MTQWEKSFYKKSADEFDNLAPIEDDIHKDPSKLRMGVLLREMTALTRSVFGNEKDLVRLQNAFFTPPKIAKDLVKFSGISESTDEILFLEPTAGAGFLIYEALKVNSNIYCDCIENMDALRVFLRTFPRTKVFDDNNFMTFENNDKYRVILMNPPFNLKKGMGLPNRSTKDVDFVMRAFEMLTKPGILVCLISISYTFRGIDNPKTQDYKIYQPFRDLLKNNEHEIIAYDSGFSKAEGAITKELETSVRMHMIKILKK
jgi:predicted RNA methylase